MRDEEPAAMEAEVVNYRHPKRPTKKTMAEQPFAVVMLAWAPSVFGEDFDSPADRDFEGFDNLEHAKKYFEVVEVWAKNDVREYGDMRHAVLLITNTKSTALEIGKMTVEGGDSKWRTAVRDGYQNEPKAIYRKTIRDRVADAGAINQGKKKAADAPKLEGRIVPKRKKKVQRKRNSAAPKKAGE